MMYDLVDCRSPILKTQVEDFDFANPIVDPLDLACNLAETMLHHNGIGLAANQCGLPYRVFVLSADEIIPCFNPRVVDYSEEVIALEEGCLSYPELFVKIKRPRRIKVRYQEPNGEVVTKTFDGMTARVFLHELDHLNGINYQQRAHRLYLERARNKYKRLQRKSKNGKNHI